MPAELRDDLIAMPAHRLAAAIAAGELTSAELTADCLARIHATNDKLHAFVAVYGDEGRCQSKILNTWSGYRTAQIDSEKCRKINDREIRF